MPSCTSSRDDLFVTHLSEEETVSSLRERVLIVVLSMLLSVFGTQSASSWAPNRYVLNERMA